MSKAEEAYELEHWGDDRGPGIVVAAGVLALATTIAVALRFWAQKLIKPRFDPDDYLILVSFVLCLGLCANTIVCVHYGIGQHVVRAVMSDTTPPDKMVNLFKAIFVEGLLWSVEIPLVKIAILLFYRRIFKVNQTWFKWAFWLSMIYSVVWGIATFIVVMLQCLPISYFWNQAYLFYKLPPPETGHCLDTRASQVPSALTNCVGDFVLLVLPFPVLWKLKMNTRRKIEIMSIFGLGAFVFGASIVRLRFIWLDENSGDPTWQDAETLAWTPVECCIGVICACIPCMAPLRRFLPGTKAKSTHKPTNYSYGGGYSRSMVGDAQLSSLPPMPRAPEAAYSSRTGKDSDSEDYNDDPWAFRFIDPTGKDPEWASGSEMPLTQPAVQGGAWADPRSSGHSEGLPPGQIKVSKDLQWTAQRTNAI